MHYIIIFFTRLTVQQLNHKINPHHSLILFLCEIETHGHKILKHFSISSSEEEVTLPADVGVLHRLIEEKQETSWARPRPYMEHIHFMMLAR